VAALRHLRVEDVAAFPHRPHEALRLVSERAAHVLDALGDALVGDEETGPDRRRDRMAVEQTPGVLGQEAQHSEGLRP
jgi:hypothetical protein